MHLFVVPVTMKESRYAGKVRLDEHGKPIIKGVLDAKNIFSPTTIKQLWADYAKCIEKYGVSKAEGKVPKGMYTEVATMDAIIKQKQYRIDELIEILLKGKGDVQEIEQKLAEISGSLDSLEGLLSSMERSNIGNVTSMEPRIQEVVAMTLFPTLADWELVDRVNDSTLTLHNSRTMSTVCIKFTPSGLLVKELKKTNEVDEYGMYISKWTEALKYVDYLHSQPKGFDDLGPVGVSKAYVRHLAKFSQMINSNQSFTEVMRAAEKVSPSVRYYLLTEYCRRNAGNLPQNVKDQCLAVKKELKEVILFPKEAKGKTNQKKQG